VLNGVEGWIGVGSGGGGSRLGLAGRGACIALRGFGRRILLCSVSISNSSRLSILKDE